MASVPTLTEFLLARFDEDEAAARSVPPLDHNFDMAGRRQDERFTFGRTLPSSADGMGNWSKYKDSPTTGAHFARHNPARVLAEVEAKRRIVARHQSRRASTSCRECGGFTATKSEVAGIVHHGYLTPWPCPTVMVLALPYADHPDYRQEWKP